MDAIFKYTNFGIVSALHGDFFIDSVSNANKLHTCIVTALCSGSISADLYCTPYLVGVMVN